MAISGISQTPHHPLPEINDDHKSTGSYLGGLVLVAGTTPLFFLAALLTVIIYYSPLPSSSPIQWLGPSDIVIILGLISTFILWLLLALLCRRFATAKRGRPSAYDLLKTEYTVLKNRLDAADQAAQEGGQSATHKVQENVELIKAGEIARADIRSNLRDFVTTLNRDGLSWVLYTGYVSMWDRLNKAGEAMIDLLPTQTIIEGAIYDKLRLHKSAVPEWENLEKNLDNDINFLLSHENEKVKNGKEGDAEAHQGGAAGKPKASQDKEKPKSKNEAIGDIRNTRSAINKYNNERWGQLVRARNRLLGIAFLAAFFIYFILVIALLVPLVPISASRPNIIENAIVFFLVGAIVGLFYRLYSEWSVKDTVSEEDDYGLTMARVIVIPLVSGLAALVGILLLTSATGSINDIYKFSLENLVFAAVLGFAPNTVFDKLTAKQKEIQKQINSTSVADHADQGAASSGAGQGNGGNGQG